MIFSDTPYERSLERMMTAIPNFAPRGHGVMVVYEIRSTVSDCDCRLCVYWQKKKGCGAARCSCIKERITAGAASHREVMNETMTAIHYPAFVRRLDKYMKESENDPMKYRNEKHRAVFAEAVKKMDRNNYALMAALYLLTADCKLWNTVKRYIERNEICFSVFRLHNTTEEAYTLYCAAKDLYLGTKHITVSDLADTDLISPKLFGLICNAMAIRRFGLGAIGERTDRR